jgi:hypothetical protein
MKSFSDFWRTDRGLTALLIFLFVTLLVAPPLLAAGLPAIVFEALLSLILISGIATVARRRWPAIVVVCLAVLSLGVRWVRIGLHLPSLGYFDTVLAILAYLTLATLVLYQVLFREGPVTLHRVQGAVAAYLLLGFAWANAYWLVLMARPEAFRFPDANADRLSLFYYSFVTLATLGYGDITPVLPAARSLAVAEALVGQLFPAVLIARLVSLEIAERAERKAGQ